MLTVALVYSCSTVLNSPKIDYLGSNYCQPTIEYDYSKLEISQNKRPKQDSILNANLSQHDILISNAIGIETYLAEYLQIKKDTLKDWY